jgi:hypothetical protein
MSPKITAQGALVDSVSRIALLDDYTARKPTVQNSQHIFLGMCSEQFL